MFTILSPTVLYGLWFATSVSDTNAILDKANGSATGGKPTHAIG